MSEARIHPTAIIGANVTIGAGTEIGPYTIVEDDVTIGERNAIKGSSTIGRYTEIGHDNTFFPYATIGLIPQDLKFVEEPTKLVIGNHNMVREHVTLHRGTGHGGGVTRIGDHNLLMVASHVAHDCLVGDHTILSHACALAGHVTVGDHAIVGAASSVHQFCHVGNHAFIGGHSVVDKDALPFIKSVGNRAKIYGINNIGLERKGFGEETIKNLRSAYRTLFHKGLRLGEALDLVGETYGSDENVAYLAAFIRKALGSRGITR